MEKRKLGNMGGSGKAAAIAAGGERARTPAHHATEGARMTRPRTPGAVARKEIADVIRWADQQELHNVVAELRSALLLLGDEPGGKPPCFEEKPMTPNFENLPCGHQEAVDAQELMTHARSCPERGRVPRPHLRCLMPCPVLCVWRAEPKAA